MLHRRSVALPSGGVACLVFLSFAAPSGAVAQEPAPPPPAPDATPDKPDAKPADDDAAAPLSDEEQKKLLDELQSAEKDLPSSGSPPPSSGIPDLSKVNLGAAIPGAASLNPDISLIFDGAAAAFGAARNSRPGSEYGDAPLMTGGHDPTTNGFTLRQVELSFAASVDPFLRFDSNIVIKDELEIEEAYATTLALPLSLQARFGEFLSKFGRQNEQHPHSWWFISQPLVYGQMMGEDNFRGLGAEVSWLSPLPWSVTLIGEVQSTQGSCCSRTFSPGEEGEPVTSPLDLVYTGVVEQFFPVTDDISVLWGLQAMTGPTKYLDATGDARGEIWGTDLLVRYKPLNAQSRWFVELTTEGMLRTRHKGGERFFEDAVVDGGGYAQLVYHPDPEWGAGVRYDYVDGLAGDLAVANGGLGPNSQRGAIVAEYAPTHFSRIQAEVNAGTRGQGDLLYGAMINLEVAIGAHGAHAF